MASKRKKKRKKVSSRTFGCESEKTSAADLRDEIAHEMIFVAFRTFFNGTVTKSFPSCPLLNPVVSTSVHPKGFE